MARMAEAARTVRAREPAMRSVRLVLGRAGEADLGKTMAA